MKILSLWQPYASFMAWGYKENETRSWATSYRGPLAIHATKNTAAIEDARDILFRAGFPIAVASEIAGRKWPLGEIVAVVELVGCPRTEDVKMGLGRRELAMGDYSAGRFAWITVVCREVKPGIPFRGMQGLKPLPEDVEKAVKARLS